MSQGALLQVVSTGVQDFWLTSEPQTTFFQSKYKKYTQFAIESVPQVFSGGTADFGRKVQCLVMRSGDLVHQAYLQISLPALTMSSGTVAWTREIGHVIIDEITLEIGGSVIDRMFGIFYSIWNELTQTEGHIRGYNKMIGNTTSLTTPAASIPAQTIMVPLLFFFCQNSALALPLIAITFHSVNINVSFRNASECYITSTGNVPTSGVPSLLDAGLYLDYVFLSGPERDYTIQQPREMLIQQLQFLGPETFSSTQIRQKLSFNHPCTELIWVTQLQSNVASGVNRWTDWTDSGNTGTNPYAGNDPLVSAKIQINATDRIDQRNAMYYNLMVPYQRHTRCPGAGIYNFAFALKPEDPVQPSGSINMSRIDGINLLLTMSTANPTTVYSFMRNLNVLKFAKGLGGLTYASRRTSSKSPKDSLVLEEYDAEA